ncbi:MAG TPA: helix-turn-helix domain-containing protein [Candidatus Gemmiger excrementigallinarum]|uniref:Helix-turn-helix domain-containing protein n=1 Tax=Candidatus Gemmiger excrementigallinarum TaxID=2838609 RepID=A0A9D2ERY3_9FIRM|nr:helix-turn-helix domain-containing protein [Candidatus Gemmiger excrementigallinarum]
MFYDVYTELCKRKGVSRSRAAADMGLSNSTVTKWKKTGATPSGDTMAKISAYFGVSVDDLLKQEKDLVPKSKVTDDDVKFALFGGGPVSDAQYEEVKQFVRFIKERDAHGKKE